MCLLDLLVRSKKSVIVAHFDHQLRPDSEKEATYICELASKLELPFICGSKDVKAFADEHKLSIEEAARKLRYEFLFSQARRMGAHTVAVAHHADDQVETVLMHFLRGAGLSGLKGMKAVTQLPEFDEDIRLIRPLLRTWRREIEKYCRENELKPIQDESNLDQTYFRNRLRHRLIPDLETYNPGFKMSLLRTAENLAGDFDLVNEVIDKAWEKSGVQIAEGYVSFKLETLREMSIGVQRHLLRRVANLLKPGIRDVNFEAVERIIRFIKEEKAGNYRVDYTDGLFVFVEVGNIFIADRPAELPLKEWPQILVESELRVGIPLQLEGDWSLLVEDVESPEIDIIRLYNDPFQAWLDVECVRGDLKVRGQKSGDRFQSMGMVNGSMKITDLFINEKIPRRARKNWPLVCINNEIVWIPGYRPAEGYRLTSSTRRSLHFRLRKTGEEKKPDC